MKNNIVSPLPLDFYFELSCFRLLNIIIGENQLFQKVLCRYDVESEDFGRKPFKKKKAYAGFIPGEGRG